MRNFFKAIAFVVSLLALLPAVAQIPSGYVQTTGTVATLANGQFGAAWTNLSSSPQLALLGCVSTFQTTVNGNLDANGHFSVLLADTAQICPSPSTWTFTFTFSCPAGTPPSAFMVAVPVAGGGSTEDISSQITAALPAVPCSGGGGGTFPCTGTAHSITCTGYVAADGIYDQESTVLVADEPLGRWALGSDMCADIAGAINYAVAQGWSSATIDARRNEWLGQQSCAHSPFQGYTPNESFTGTLLLQGSDISIATTSAPSGCGPTGANTCLGVVPGGWRVDGGNNHADNNNATSAYPGTIIRPASQVPGFVILSLGSTNDPNAPTGASLSNISVSCVPDSGTYVNGSETIGIENANGQQWASLKNVQVTDCGAAGVDLEQSSATQTGTHVSTNNGGGDSVVVNMPADITTAMGQPIGFEFGGFTSGSGATLTATCSGGIITGISGSGGTGYNGPAWVGLTNSTGTVISAVPNSSGVLSYTLVAPGTCTGTPVATISPMGLTTFGGISGVGLWTNLTAQIPPQTCSGCTASQTQSGVGIGVDIQGQQTSVNYLFAQFQSVAVRVGTINNARHSNVSLVKTVNGLADSQDLMIQLGSLSGDIILNNIYPGGGGSATTASAYSASGSTLTVTAANSLQCTLGQAVTVTSAPGGDGLTAMVGGQYKTLTTGCSSSGFNVTIPSGLITGSGSTAAVFQTAATLYDALHPEGPCTVQSAGDFLTSYIRPGTHGNGGIAFSGATAAYPACPTYIPGVPFTTQSNTFGAFNQYFNSNNIILPSGTTAGTNFGANGAFELWAWCGVTATCPGTLGNLTGGGLSLQFTSGGLAEMAIAPPGPGSTGWTPNSQFSLPFNNIYLGGFGAGAVTSTVAISGTPKFFSTPTSTYGIAFGFPSTGFTNGRNMQYLDGANQAVTAVSLTSTSASSDNFTIQGVTSSSHCSAPAPTNASAATNQLTTVAYVSAKAANQITVTHAAVANMTYDISCTYN